MSNVSCHRTCYPHPPTHSPTHPPLSVCLETSAKDCLLLGLDATQENNISFEDTGTEKFLLSLRPLPSCFVVVVVVVVVFVAALVGFCLFVCCCFFR